MKKLFIAALFAVVSAFTTFGGTAYAAANEGLIGFVNFDLVVQNCPGFADAQKQIQQEQQRLQKQYDSEAADLDDAGKLELTQKLNSELAKRDADIIKPIQEKVIAAIKAAAEKNGVKQVVRMEILLYGGLDLTNEVIGNLKK